MFHWDKKNQRGLPGPLVKWFIKTIGPRDFNLAPDSNAQTIAMLGYKTKYYTLGDEETRAPPAERLRRAIFQPTDSDKTRKMSLRKNPLQPPPKNSKVEKYGAIINQVIVDGYSLGWRMLIELDGAGRGTRAHRGRRHR